jgi:hypothetical protein
VTMYFCVMETTAAIGVGECAAMTDTVQGVQSRGGVMGMGIRPQRTDGTVRTTNYVYAGLTEGTIPWQFTGAAPPRAGETVGGSRVLAVVQLPRRMSFRCARRTLSGAPWAASRPARRMFEPKWHISTRSGPSLPSARLGRVFHSNGSIKDGAWTGSRVPEHGVQSSYRAVVNRHHQ